ncbi:MAG: GHKL domain-containing protein, partial [Calditrichaeota bacterium]|nr:GHKL domain-containing protein [Calditrichota bacterium]
LLIFANVYNVIFRIRLMGFKRLSELPENNNQHSQDIIRFIFLIITQIYYTNPRLIPFMIAIMIKQSLIHGITLYSPAAMVMLSSFLINIAQRDVGFAFHLADTAVELSNRFNENKLIASEFLKINFVDYWRQPLSTINQFLLPLYDQSISSGEYEYGALALVTFCNNAFYDGVKLAELNETISQLKMKVLHVKQEMSLQELNSLQQMIQVLIAQTYSPIETPEFIETDEHSNRTMKCKFYMMNMVISYFLENYDDAIQNSKLSYLYIDSLSLGPLNILFHFFSSLSYLSHTNLPERQKVIRKKLFTLIKFRKKMQFNFKPFQMILLAKWLSYKGKSIPAYRILKKLINDPENRSNYFTTALTYEEAAKLLAKSNPDLSQFYYLKAHMAYTEWGASFKAKQIKEKYLQQYDLAKSTEINSSNSIDILSILKASETLSREVRINDLLLKLLNILMENSGAQRCRLILNENGKLMGRAVCCSKERDERIIYDPIEGNDSYPSLMIHEVFRTELQIVLEDASHSKFSYTDPYILKNQSKSILVYPIKSQNGIQAILLLENDLIAGAFNSERLSLLNILSSQIAISLENARLYETLEDKVESRMQDLKRTQKQLIQAEKMSSLGVLTAGIAHEMNTPLAYVKNNFILVNRMIQDGNLNEQKQTSINKLLNDCEYGITKVSEIVKGLKDFSRKDDDSMQRISLADILQQALIIGQNLIKKHQILLESNIEKSVMIDCYPVQLEQVFLNIINNSCYALSKRKITNSDQSRIKISCTKKTSHLLISFWDNGNGIDPELVSNIFDPFFTTKEVGEGTGLGLSICYNIIKAHHGNIRVNSDGKSFTEFLIKLPLAKIPETSELIPVDH